MGAWPKLFVLFLLCLVGAEVVKAVGKAKPRNEELFDFTKEDDPKFDYSSEHDENEISNEEQHPEKPDFRGIGLVVCSDKGASRCTCDKKAMRVDCNQEKLKPDKDGSFAIMSANIADDFHPKYVYLVNNRITSLDQDTLLPTMVDTVEGIDLGMNDIEVIYPKAFDNFKNLRKLRLNHNWINKWNETEDGWITEKLGTNLTLLNLAYNGITTINPGAFDSLHNLERLILDGNKNISLKSDTFGKNGLKKLSTLSLDYCNINKLDEKVFENLPSLSYLSLIGNPITSVPVFLGSIETLHILDLSETPFKKWENRPMKEFGALKKLFLKDITKNPYCSKLNFNDCVVSRLLLFYMKELTEFGDCAFCGLTSLTNIDIGGSKKLTSIHENAFGFKNGTKDKTLMIKDFQMTDCSIKHFQKDLLPWGVLENIEIGGNPIDCDAMHYFFADMYIHALHGKTPAKCAYPPDKNGTLLTKLIKDYHSNSGISDFFKTVFYMGISMAIVGTLLTVILHLSKKYDGSISNLFNRQRSSGAGFSNLNADVNMEDERVFDEEEDNEFEPRPAAV